MLPFQERAIHFKEKIAVSDSNGEHSYEALLNRAEQVASHLLRLTDAYDLGQKRVSILTSPNTHYLHSLWGIWLAGGVAVPLCPSHPTEELRYFIKNSQSDILLVDEAHHAQAEPLNNDCTVTSIEMISPELPIKNLPLVSIQRRANILYTSGTTNRPKGVVTTHAQLTGQIKTLVSAWQWHDEDRTLNVLPLHHTHGLVNVVCCSLYSGAHLEMQTGFDAEKVWQTFLLGRINVFMAVPTIYNRLLRYYDSQSLERQQVMSDALSKFRLMVSGSAALPTPLFESWEKISGHRLLERYGMTEIGMAISNPYQGERRPGHVGLPLPGVEILLVDEQMQEVPLGEAGQILVRGDNIFSEYWNNLAATESAFYQGWFLTGDIARVENKSYKILGRDNIDIIKSGGYKISALEIESVLKAHPKIEEVAIVGVEDPDWGERIVACIVLKPNKSLSLEEIRFWGDTYLAKYKLPSILHMLDELPKNAMGKINKKQLKSSL